MWLWNTIVPILGPMATKAAPKDIRFYPADAAEVPTPAALVRSLWEGAIVVYYDENAKKNDIAALKVIAQERDGLNLIVVPWQKVRNQGPGTRQALPDRRSLAWAAWGSSQSCHALTPVTLDEFRADNPVGSAPGVSGAHTPGPFSVTVSGQRMKRQCDISSNCTQEQLP